jgi:hypothetical protein
MDRDFKLFKTLDAAGIEVVLARIERSFAIKFDHESLVEVNSYRMLSEIIINKLNLEHEDTCTTQHAFYLLRNAIAASTGTDKCSITPPCKLSKLFPREDRLKVIDEVNQELGFETNLLQPKQWVIGVFTLILLVSFVGFFYNWQIAAAGCLASVLGLKLAGKFGKEIHLKTVGDLANKISRESYMKARRNSTVNKNEIEQKVRELFANDLGLQPVMIRRESQF